MRAMFIQLAVGAIFLTALGAVHAETAGDISVVNRAATAIVEIYVSDSNEDSWGDDRLGEQPVPPNRVFRVAAGGVAGCAVDIRVVYADGRAEDKRRVDICRSRTVSFDATTAAVPQDTGAQRVTFTNGTHRTITELYLSSAASSDWGDNRLSHPIAAARQEIFTHAGGCVIDLRVVFDTRAAEERRRIDICRNQTVAIEPGWTTTDALESTGSVTEGARPDHRT